MAIQQTHLATLNTDYVVLSSPSSGSYANVGLIFCNYSTSAAIVQVHVNTTSGSTSADTNSIFRDIEIAPKDSFVLNVEKLLIGTTDKVIAKSSVSSAVVVTATYMPI